MNSISLISKSILPPLMIIFGCLTFNSCTKEEVYGCTNPESENFNPDATVDDGSCTYIRDRFLGTYKSTGNQFCDEELFVGTLTIVEDAENTQKVKMILNTFGVIIELSGIMNESTIVFSGERTDPEYSVSMSGTTNP